MIKVKMYTKPKTATGSTTSSGGGVVYANTQSSGRAGYADKAGRAAVADKAEYADKAGVAENVSIESEVLQHFLRSDEEDTAEKRITFAEGLSAEAASTFKALLTLLDGLTLSDGAHGITPEGVATLKKIVSAAFTPGVGGKGFVLGDTYGTTTDSYLEVDRIYVRKAAEFVKLVIRELQSVGGEIVLSPAAMKVSMVESIPKGATSPDYESGAPYDMTRCYFLQKTGSQEIVNQFVKNDLVRCQTFNIKTGTSESARNRYYWRRVHAVGSDYIDVVNSSGEGTDQPAAGDELVQMGNTTDTARQSVILISAYADDAPSITMYRGVNTTSLAGKEILKLSRKEMYALANEFKFVSKAEDGTTTYTSFAQIVASMDGLRSNVVKNYATKDSVATLTSTIEQKADKVSLQVTEEKVDGLESGLKTTGVDIENGIIKAQTDTFIIQNRDGEVTARVNEKGQFETFSGLFSGFVRKNRTLIKAENIDKYTTASLDAGYRALDFAEAGSFVEFTGNFDKDIAVILPFYLVAPGAWVNIQKNYTLDDAFSYLGQTIIIRNRSSKSVNIVGYYNLVTRETDATQKPVIGTNHYVVLTCTYIYDTTKKKFVGVAWNGYKV